MTPLDLTAAQYLREHGQRSVSAAVRRWVEHPKSVRNCGSPMGAAVPVVAGDGCRLWSLKQCRNRFVDPYCSGWFRAGLAERIGEVLASARDDGHPVGMVVLTVQHRQGEKLADVMAWHAAGWARVCQRPDYQRWEAAWLKVWDIVVGGPNGPHPHVNVPLVLPRGADVPEFAEWLARAWATSLHAVTPRRWRDRVSPALREYGARFVSSDQQDVGRIAVYAARHLPADKAGFEAVDDRNRQSLGGYGLLDLACMAHAGQDDAGRLLAACAVDLAGKRSWSASKRWTERPEWASAGDSVDDVKADADALMAGRWCIGFLPSGEYRRHRVIIDALLDGLAGADVATCRASWAVLRDSAGVGVTLLDEPLAAEDVV